MIGEVHNVDWRELADRVKREVGMVDALIVDAPYSATTHVGHDGGERYDGSAVDRGDEAYGHRLKTRGIDYPPWTPDDVSAFVATWAPLTVGWMVSLTDDVLWPSWRSAMKEAGRVTFAALPMIDVGSRVRLSGDGPSSWSCWLSVSRPADGAWLKRWRESRRARAQGCALPGYYVQNGHGDRAVMGGKRTDAMEKVVDHYTEPGDLVIDPCCGGGTTLVAAKLLGRRFIGGDIDANHVEIARKRVASITMGRPLALNFGDVG